jgi:phenylalanyl-tRNA synthetase alpha chain
MAEFYKKIGIT